MRSAAPIDRRFAEDRVRICESPDAIVRCLRLRLAKQGNRSVTYVFYGPDECAARKAGFAAAVLLGMVITHALGHFFGLEHGLGGIMLPGFRETETLQALSGALTFDRVQAQYLRTAIATRLRQWGRAK